MAFGDDFREWFWNFVRGGIFVSDYVGSDNRNEVVQRYATTAGQQESYSPIQTPDKTINQIAGYEVNLDNAEKGAEMLLEASIDMNLFLLNVAVLPIGTSGTALTIGASLLAWQQTGNIKYRNAAILQALFLFLQVSGFFDKIGEGLNFILDKVGFKDFLSQLGIVADDALIEMAESEARVLFEELGEDGFKNYISKYGVSILNSTGEMVTVRRVQNNTNARILVNEDGSITMTTPDANLSVSIDDGAHSQYFLDDVRAGTDSYVVEFDIPKWLDDMIKEYEIPQSGSTTNPLNQGGMAPKIVDPNQPGISYELPPPWPEWLEEYANNAQIIN